MKKIAHPFFFLIELLVRCRLTFGDPVIKINCTYLENNAKALCIGRTDLGWWAKLILEENDPKLYGVTTLELRSEIPVYHTWLITDENMLTRFTKLVNFSVTGQLEVDEHKSFEIQSNFFNFSKLDTIHIASAKSWHTQATYNAGFTLPQNLRYLVFESASLDLINWKSHSRLVSLRIQGDASSLRVPDFSYPWLENLNIAQAPSTNFTIPGIGFLCRMTLFEFNVDTLLKDACRCHLMQNWQEYLKNESSPLEIRITGDNTKRKKFFNETECNPMNVTCSGSEDILKDAKDRRAKCIEMVTEKTTTSLTPSSTLNPNNTTPSSTLSPNKTTPFSKRFLYIVIGLLIVAAALAILASLAYRFYPSGMELESGNTAGGALTEEEMPAEESQVEEIQVEPTQTVD